jgi:heptosyltransferase-2
VVDLSGHTSLVQLAGVLAASSAVVTNDSGAMHLAAAVGARVIAVFGATDEVRTAPLRAGPDAPAAAILTHDVFCRPCLLRECPIDHRCMRGVTAERVFEAVARAVEPQGVGRKP